MADFDINALIGAQRSASVNDAIAHPAQINLLGGVQSGIEAAKSVMDIRGAAARQAIGEMQASSINPDGSFDAAAFNRKVAANPQLVALGAQAGMQNAQTLSKDQYDLHNTRLTSLMSGMAQLVADNPNGVPADAAHAVIDHRQQMGVLTPEEAQAAHARITSDPIKNTQFILQGMSANLSSQLALDAARPPTGTLETGQGTTGIQGVPKLSSSPNQGAIAPVGPRITTGLPTISKLLDQVDQPITDEATAKQLGVPMGTQMTIPLIKRLIQQGVGSLATGGNAPATITPTVTSMPPGTKERWEASTALYNRDLENLTNYQARLFPLAQVWSILASGNVTTGQGAEALNRAKSFLMTAGSNLGFDMSKLSNVKDMDELGKYMQQYVNAQGMSGRSDQALASAITGNPSSHLNTLANTEVVKPLIAMERMKFMAMQDFKKTGTGNSNDYSQFLADWQLTHDPRAFMFDMLNKDQRLKMLQGMTDGERARYNHTLDLVQNTPGVMSLAPMPH